MARILVIDDEAPLRAVLRRILERAGHDVVDAPDGGAGVERQITHRPHVVLTDIHMPGPDARETIRALRRQDPQVRIVVISGDGTTGETLDDVANTLGADRGLAKPFEVSGVLRTVAELLDGTQ